MGLLNRISHFIGSHRFLSRKLRSFQPEISPIFISKSFTLFLDPKDLSGPSYNVMYDKSAAFYRYEEELKADLLQYLARDGVFFDVGGNIGVISFFVKTFYPGSPIVIFEPGNIASKCLKKTIEVNKIKNVTLVTKGVSDKVGVAEFFIDPKSTGGSSLVRKHFDKTKKNIEKIELIGLDDYVAETKVFPSLVKVDVEGAENLVIAGARNLIKNHKPNFIIECENSKILEDLTLWREVFLGYKFRKVGTSDFSSILEIENVVKKYLSEGTKIMDILLVPDDI